LLISFLKLSIRFSFSTFTAILAASSYIFTFSLAKEAIEVFSSLRSTYIPILVLSSPISLVILVALDASKNKAKTIAETFIY